MVVLSDHISKEMNELNLIRCQKIPKRPGADWHDLPDEKVRAGLEGSEVVINLLLLRLLSSIVLFLRLSINCR